MLLINISDVFHMHDEFIVVNPLFKEVLLKMAAKSITNIPL